VLAKLFETILLHRIRSFWIPCPKLIPDTQFGFRSKHFTIQRIHRIIDKISFRLVWGKGRGVNTALASSSTYPKHSTNIFQSHLTKIEKWASNWKIPFTLTNETSPVLHFEGMKITTKTQIKYLGLTLNKHLTWGPHLEATRKILYRRLHLFRPILISKYVSFPQQ